MCPEPEGVCDCHLTHFFFKVTVTVSYLGLDSIFLFIWDQ